MSVPGVASEEAVDKSLQWMDDNVGSLSQAIANRQHVEQWVKVVEAQQKALRKEEPAYVQEREARCSTEYAAALFAFKVAVEEEQKLRYRWQLALTAIDVYRTRAANVRKL